MIAAAPPAADSSTLPPRLSIAALLALVALVPLHADLETARVFEENKVLLFRLLGLFALGGAILARPAWRAAGWGGIGVLLFVCGSLVAALFSASPALALPGDYTRQQGLLTDLAGAGVFLAALELARTSRAGIGALVDVLRIGAAVAGLLALVQASGFDVLFGALGSRAGSFAGGPTFLGSHLAAILPLALATSRSRVDVLLAAPIALGLIASGSRVAAVAGVAGCAIAALASAAPRRGRLLIGLAAALAAAGALAIPAVREALPEDALPNRVFAETVRADLDSRLELWDDASTALFHDPLRVVIGHGPDTIGPEFAPFVSANFQRRVGATTRIDRFHSDGLDVWFTRGVFALLGLIVIFAGAIRSGRRVARLQNQRPLAAGWLGALTVIGVDGALSVPGATSRLLMFLGAGLLAGLATHPMSGTPPRDERRESFAAPAMRSLLAGLGVIGVAFALRNPADFWIALPFALLIVPVWGQIGSIRPGLSLIVGFGVVAFVIDFAVGSRSSVFSPSLAAGHGTLYRLGFHVAVAAGTALLVKSVACNSGARPFTIRRRVLAVVIGGLWLWAARDDVLRGIADVEASVAAQAQSAGGRPIDAAGLLAAATRHAPEVAHYRSQRALALVDLAAQPSAAADPTALLEALGVEAGAAVERHPRDGWVLARAAHAILRMIPFAPRYRAGLERRALELAERAAVRAPTAAPVLEVAAEALLRVERNDEAVLLLERSFQIDARRGRTHQLRGRAAVARGDREQAAQWHALAVATDVDPAESFAALALAAMGERDVERAATMLLRLATRVTADHRFDVAPARKLLTFVAFDQHRDAFALAREKWNGDPGALNLVEQALAY